MKEEDIQQAFSRLEKLFQQGHIAEELFRSKKKQLFLQWNTQQKQTNDTGRSPIPIENLAEPFRRTHKETSNPEKPFSPPPRKLLTRPGASPSPERTISLSADGLEQLVDKQTAAEIRAITFVPKNERNSSHSPLEVPEEHERSEFSSHIPKLFDQGTEQRGRPEIREYKDVQDHQMEQRRSREAEKIAQMTGAHNIIGKNAIRVNDILRDRYRLVKLLGAGGMGQVFLVEDMRFGGNYAAKVLHPWVVQHEPTISRFIQEFKIIEGLNHPGIVRTYMLDEDPGRGHLFYLMEYIHGKTLQDVLERAVGKREGPPFSGEETLHFLEKLSEILEYMHKRRVLHRDLKPTNIMLYKNDAGYSLKLLDFGLAKWMTETNDPALHTGHAGTFFYIAPEQLMGGEAALEAADVFSLGVILYQMLTGSLPVAMAVPPSEINLELPKQIDVVLRKAMNVHGQQRYQTVGALLKDFKAVFYEEPKSTKPTPEEKKAALQKSKSSSYLESLIHNDSVLSEPEEDKRLDSLELEDHSGSDSFPLASDSHLPSFTNSVPLAPPKKETLPSFANRRSEKPASSKNSLGRPHSSHPTQISNVQRLARLRERGPHASPHPTERPSSNTKFGPSSSRNTNPKSTSFPKKYPPKPARDYRRDSASRPNPKDRERGAGPSEQPPLHSIQTSEGQIHSIVLSGDGRFAATASDDRKIQLWDTASWFLLHTITVDEPISCLSWSPIDDTVAFGMTSGEVQVWKILSTQRLFTYSLKSSVLSMDWMPDGQTIVTGSLDGMVVPWSLKKGSLGIPIFTRQEGVYALAVNASGQMLATSSKDQRIKVWNASKGSLLLEFSAPHEDAFTCFQFAPKRSILLSGSQDHDVCLWDAQNNTLQMTLKKHQGTITCVSFSPDDSWFVSASEDQNILLWSAATGKLLKSFNGHRSAIRALCVSPKGDWLVATDDDRTIKVWDTTLRK